jgi:NAD(P)H-dependent FMN reductase
MSATPSILAFAGSARKDSFNKKVLRIAAEGARRAGAEVTLIDLRDFPLRLFDQDLEAAEGAPAEAVRLKGLFVAHDGLLIASPEYNSSISPLLKNAIDWVSRPAKGEKPLVAFSGKVAALLAASPGALGGLRGLVHVRSILGNIGVVVLPDQAVVSGAADAFGEDGGLRDPKLAERVAGIGSALAAFIGRLKRSGG